jgi:hypothetical protein
VNYLSTREAAACLGCSVWTLHDLLSRGCIPRPKRKVGPCFLWDPDDLENGRAALANRPPRGRPPLPRKEAARAAS